MPDWDVNYISVLIASAAFFVLGGVWFGVLGAPWKRLIGKTDEQLRAGGSRGLVRVLVTQFVAYYLLVTLLAYLLVDVAGADTFAEGAGYALIIAVIAQLVSGGNDLFEGRPLKLWLLYTAYTLIGFALVGGILAVW